MVNVLLINRMEKCETSSKLWVRWMNIFMMFSTPSSTKIYCFCFSSLRFWPFSDPNGQQKIENRDAHKKKPDSHHYLALVKLAHQNCFQ